MTVQSFIFRTEEVIGALQALRLARAVGEAVAVEAARILTNPARIALESVPETALLLRALEAGLGDPEGLFREIQVRSETIERRFAGALPVGHRYDLQFLAHPRLVGDPAPRGVVQDLVLASGMGGTDPADLPILFGGFFAYDRGGCARIHWDSALYHGHTPFPLKVLLRYDEDLSLEMMIAPDERLDPEQVRRLSRPRLPPEMSARAGIESELRVTEDLYSPSSFQLDPKIPQILFFPGSVWEVETGTPTALEAFPYSWVAGLVRETRRFLRGEEPEWPPDHAVRVRQQSLDETWLFLRAASKPRAKEHRATIRWEPVHPSGLQAAWDFQFRLGTGEILRATAFPVVSRRAQAVETYVSGRWPTMIQYGRALTALTRRQR